MAASGSTRSGEPFTANWPALYSRSSSAASSWWAAMVRALSSTFSVAMRMAVPPTDSERDP